MIVFGVFIFYIGWSMTIPVEAWSGEYWGRIFILVAVAVTLQRIIEAIEKDN